MPSDDGLVAFAALPETEQQAIVEVVVVEILEQIEAVIAQARRDAATRLRPDETATDAA